MIRNLLLFSSALAMPLLAAPRPALIPLPSEVQFNKGDLKFTGKLKFIGSKETQNEAKLLNAKTKDLWKSATNGAPIKVALKTKSHLKDKLGEEGYTLNITAKGIAIEAATTTGLFYASQTLLQLAQTEDGQTTLPYTSIEDSPRFAWRGLMLDEARHFMGKEYVKQLLDNMAAHKLNKFHWHLTDDQGWRIEIKAFPKLTSVGSHRGEGTQLRTPSWDKKKKTDPDGPKYSGHYTQDDIREIVAYAQARHIEILPEIDVPGHARAIVVAYPETQPKNDRETGKGVHGLSGNVLSVVNEDNYRMLDTIFGEIASLFPSEYIHIGGDEVNVNSWKASPEHRKYMEKHDMKNPSQLQNMFMLRLEKILKKHDRTMMGWNEIMHGGQLSKDTGVMAWISVGAGLHAARAGHPTIMAPGPHCYFDMKYPGHSETGHWWAGAVSTKQSYEWNPVFAGQLKPKEQARIKGIQCALWTEFVPDTADANYKFWPRACATSEVAWTAQDKREWKDFDSRLGQHLDYLDTLNIDFRVKPPTAVQAKGKITIVPPYKDSKVLFTIDGTEPDATSDVYKGQELPVSDLNSLRYRHIRPDGRMSKVERGAQRAPVFTWEYKQSGEFKIDVTDTVDKSGPWIAEFSHKRGKHGLDFTNIQLLENGKKVSEIKDFGVSNKSRKKAVRFNLVKFNKGARYEIVLQSASSDGDQSKGQITLDRSPYIEPNGATATTDIPAYGNNSVEKVADWDRGSFFWSSRGGKKGDTLDINFENAVEVTEIVVPSGKPNTNSDIIVNGQLEYSTDGKSFRSASKFNLGTATIKLNKPTKIKALRITLKDEQESWFIIRDPQLK